MPIYAYRCAACGHAKDVLQKMSDAPLTTCPACGAEQFQKQVTAAGFQLKGSGWYATDFRGGSGGTSAAAPAATSAPASSDTGGSSGGDSGPSTPCGGSCACH
ncbi:FmdB family zinc ribbon protein [Ideonella oryzae]|uniref:Zinc ribbon domain-containing protein n=1 Tax=Ideonella oryzae TaxID=2937441 RepID=A0ABT1BJV1_9BURK|nr:FmdB family zinc ribbon protein [Ideonella oryzae]MCO5975892.1 zinc ribbon domain-containing protein [Ideonella oryzae]